MGVYTIVQQGGRAVAGMKLRLTCMSAWQDQVGLFGINLYCTAQVLLGARLGEIAKVYCDALKAPVTATQAPDVTFVGIKVSQVGSPPPVLPGIAQGTDIGSANPVTQPGQVSGVITYVTPVAGRAYRGRCYVPFPSTDFLAANNYPTGGYFTLLQAIKTQLITAVTVVGGGGNTDVEPILFHRSTGAFTAIDEGHANQKWGTQRRRGSYGQKNQPYFI